MKPRIVPFEFITPIFAGQSTQVTCLVSEGDIPIDIWWNFTSPLSFSEIGVSTHKIAHQGSVLLIPDTNARHQGWYTCSAKNQAGHANYSALLEIHGK